MTKIIDFNVMREKNYLSLVKRKENLERLIMACDITYKSLLDIEDITRTLFTNMVDKYNTAWKKELESVNNQLTRYC